MLALVLVMISGLGVVCCVLAVLRSGLRSRSTVIYMIAILVLLVVFAEGVRFVALDEAFSFGVPTVEKQSAQERAVIRYELAKAYMMAGNYKRALVELKAANRLDPEPHYEQAIMEAENRLHSERILRSAEEYRAGTMALEQGRYETAIAHFRDVLEEDEQHYHPAQQHITDAEKLWAKDLYEHALTLMDSEDYSEALLCALKAHDLDPDFSDAERLAKEADRLYSIQQALVEMRQWSGTGVARVAVSEVVTRASLIGDLFPWSSGDSDTHWYLLIHVAVLNASERRVHVNPTNFMLLHGKHAISSDWDMFFIRDHFKPIDLQPDTYGAGWVVFRAPKGEEYTLVYQGRGDKVVRKRIVITEHH